ncbi:hypothetical protein CoNPh26_CDS0139 [Staphylococcus phage S-CoN_Ph26]|nr:hypothetical protein CoNPh26_CDS0139 [Staphylococcus phage S-CoN_Ph26]
MLLTVLPFLLQPSDFNKILYSIKYYNNTNFLMR